MPDQPQANPHKPAEAMDCLGGFYCRQVKPHFLFNALSLISATAQDTPELAQRLVLCLADLLRAGIGHEDTDSICLEDEVNLVKSYLAIEQERFPGRFAVRYDMPEGLPAAVPAFTLVRIAEHLLRETVLPCGGGDMAVSAAQAGGVVRCEVAVALRGGRLRQPSGPVDPSPLHMVARRLTGASGPGLDVESADGLPVRVGFALPIAGEEVGKI